MHENIYSKVFEFWLTGTHFSTVLQCGEHQCPSSGGHGPGPGHEGHAPVRQSLKLIPQGSVRLGNPREVLFFNFPIYIPTVLFRLILDPEAFSYLFKVSNISLI